MPESVQGVGSAHSSSEEHSNCTFLLHIKVYEVTKSKMSLSYMSVKGSWNQSGPDLLKISCSYAIISKDSFSSRMSCHIFRVR